MHQLVVEFQAIAEDGVIVVYFLLFLRRMEREGSEIFSLRVSGFQHYFSYGRFGGCDAEDMPEIIVGLLTFGDFEFAVGDHH